jgi:hypothetical protein
MHRTTIGDPEKHKTEIIGERESIVVVQKLKGARLTIMVAGVAGLIMSLCIAFFIEYIEESKSRRKGK